MEKKRPIDIKRESGGAADIGSVEDGAIEEMFEFDGCLLCVKEKSIYEMRFADAIDPKRENEHLPTTIHNLVLPYGSESEMVCRTFLTARKLFGGGHISKNIDTKRALVLALEALKEFAAMDKEAIEYLEAERKTSEEYESRRGKKMSYALPSVTDVHTKCKTFFQKTDHVTQTLMEIVTLFYSTAVLNKQSHYETFHEFISKKYGEQDMFTKFLSDTLPFLKLIRALRNCLDHRLAEVQVKNFELQPNSDVLAPTIELDYRGSKLERISISELLPIIIKNTIGIFEEMIALLSERNVRADGFPSKVSFIPAEKRRNKFIRYCFWSPLGEGGFYHQ